VCWRVAPPTRPHHWLSCSTDLVDPVEQAPAYLPI
jgi:hypothetical protein